MSLFGSGQTTQPSGGGLFGSGNNTQQQPSGGPFGSGNPSQGTGNNLFGASQAPPASSGGLFGATGSQAQSGGLFGANPAANTNTNQGSSLFGTAASSQPAQPSNTNSLFGGASLNQNPSQNQTQSKPTLNLFGNSSNTNIPPQQQNSLFGNLGASAGNNVQQQRPSLFSGTSGGQPHAAAQQQQQSNFFGASQALPSLTLGQSMANQQQQQSVPGVKIDVSNIRGTTRFNDLHEDIQKHIEQIDTFIQQQISLKEQCDAIMPSHTESLQSIPVDVEFITNKEDTVQLTIGNNAAAVDGVKSTVKNDISGARVGFRAVENLKLPQQFHYSGAWTGYHGASSMSPPAQRPSRLTAEDGEGSVDLVAYFTEQAKGMGDVLALYIKNISDIELHLRNIEASTIAQSQQMMFSQGRDGAGRGAEEQIRELQAVLGEFRGGIHSVESKVSAVKREAQSLVLRRSNGR